MNKSLERSFYTFGKGVESHGCKSPERRLPLHRRKCKYFSAHAGVARAERTIRHALAAQSVFAGSSRLAFKLLLGSRNCLDGSAHCFVCLGPHLSARAFFFSSGIVSLVSQRLRLTLGVVS